MNQPYRHFLEQFADWERLGRGDMPVSEHPVSLEPPFWPFPGYRPPKPKTIDDGSRPTFLTRFFDAARPPTAKEDEAEEFDIEFDFFERESVVEISVSLPPDFSPKSPALEALLQQITECRDSVALEIFGTSKEVKLQFATSDRDADFLIGILRTYFPQGVFRRDPDSAFSAFKQVDPSDAVILDCGLDREFLLPLASPRIDPFIGFVGALSELSESQFAMIQVLFQPVTRPWSSSIFSSTLDEEGQPLPWIDPALAKAAIEKASAPLFAVAVRFCAGANDIEEACRLITRLAAPLHHFSNPAGNSLAPLDPPDDYPLDTQLADLFSRQSHRFGMLLTSEELLGLVHLPGAEVSTSRFSRQVTRTRPAPTAPLSEQSLYLGENEHHGEQKSIYLSMEERTSHMHVIGASGTGKSNFLLNSILQDIRNGHGCALLDPHGDLVKGVLEHLPEERVQDVILFDPSDEEYPVGFNILSARSDIEKNLLASDFVSIFQRLSAAWGDQMTAVLGNATLAILESPQGGTLMDLRRFLVERGFRQEFLKTVQDPEVRYFWEHEFPLLKGNTQASLLTRLNSFIRQKLIRNMIAQDGAKLDFAEIMDGRKIFLAPLSQGLIGQENSWLLGSLLVSKFYQIALSRQSQAESAREPFWLYIDEAHHFITESIASILSGTRKYGLGLVLAHQQLDQFGRQDAAILSSILTNAHTRVCFRVGDQDARKLQEGFEHFEAEDLRRLRRGRAICLIGESDHDFNLATSPPPEEARDASVAEAARAHSRERYATPRSEIEATVNEQASARAEAVKRETEARRTKKAAPRAEGPTTVQPPAPAEAPPAPASAPSSSSPPIPTEERSSAPPTEPAPAPPVEEAEPAKKPPKALPAAAHYKKGWGGPKHKALQERIKNHANGLGFRATIEGQLPEGAGSVDVLIETQTRQIAIEVALKSPIEQEVRNIAKAIETGISRVVVVSDSAAHLGSIREAAEGANLDGLTDRVTFIHEDEIGEFLNSLRSSIPPSETSMLGYKVTTKYNKLSEAEQRARKEAMHRALNEARRRIQGGSEEGDEAPDS